MSKEIAIKIHEIAVDGLPPEEDDTRIGQVGFIFDGSIFSGQAIDSDTWEDDHSGQVFYGVTHWIEFPLPVWELTKESQ